VKGFQWIGQFLFKNSGRLGLDVAVLKVEAMGVGTGAAGGDTEDLVSLRAGPCFDFFAEVRADAVAAEAVLYDEAPDEDERIGLEVTGDGDFDPADELGCSRRGCSRRGCSRGVGAEGVGVRQATKTACESVQDARLWMR
jgi:hypothetical protein